ncbi:MAG: VIT1/CCC1 transporter family protein [Lacipirellulaceae bacterium]
MNDADYKAHVADHHPAAVRVRLQSPTKHSYLRDFVFGAIDGIVTTFAVVSGVAGAGLSPGVVLILGAANLVGDGFSMAASNYLATRSDDQLRARARRAEAEQIERYPEGEREEVRQIYRRKGFTGADLDRVVEVITADRERWLETMLTEELRIPLSGPSPLKAALATFVAFVVLGALPLVVFLPALFTSGESSPPYLASAAIAMASFFGVGAVKSVFVDQHWLAAALETLAAGAAAAAAAYGVGVALSGLGQ